MAYPVVIDAGSVSGDRRKGHAATSVVRRRRCLFSNSGRSRSRFGAKFADIGQLVMLEHSSTTRRGDPKTVKSPAINL